MSSFNFNLGLEHLNNFQQPQSSQHPKTQISPHHPPHQSPRLHSSPNFPPSTQNEFSTPLQPYAQYSAKVESDTMLQNQSSLPQNNGLISSPNENLDYMFLETNRPQPRARTLSRTSITSTSSVGSIDIDEYDSMLRLSPNQHNDLVDTIIDSNNNNHMHNKSENETAAEKSNQLIIEEYSPSAFSNSRRASGIKICYKERRRRNNEASKKCRENSKKCRENSKKRVSQIMSTNEYLTKENLVLKEKLATLTE
eukprot:Pgem_evm1s12348